MVLNCIIKNMNRKTLQRVIDELQKEIPRIPYVLGVLETLLETLPEDKALIPVNLPAIFNPVVQDDEAKALDYMAKAKLEGVKLMSDESNH